MKVTMCTIPVAFRSSLFRSLAGLVLLTGCSEKPTYDIYPQNASGGQVPISVGASLEVGFRLKNVPQGLRVRYHWASEKGRCEPSETSEPFTRYFAPVNECEDVVRGTVLQPDKIVYSASTSFQVGIARASAPQARASFPEVGPVRTENVAPGTRPQILITNALPYDPIGGDGTSTSIEGYVSGEHPEQLRVVLYVFTDRWYVQPTTTDPFTEIAADGKWSTWIHTGMNYAALLVNQAYNPRPVLTSIEFPSAYGNRNVLHWASKMGSQQQR